MKQRGRSVLALAAACATVVALSIGTDAALHALGVFPPSGTPMGNGLLALALAYRALYGIVGSYVAARLAPVSPMAHALGSGVVGLIASAAGAIATWNAGPAFGPHWYPLALMATTLPCAWAGGKLHAALQRETH